MIRTKEKFASYKRSAKGFTLAELMIALVVAGVVATAIIALVTSFFRNAGRIDSGVNAWNRLQDANVQIQRDVNDASQINVADRNRLELFVLRDTGEGTRCHLRVWTADPGLGILRVDTTVSSGTDVDPAACNFDRDGSEFNSQTIIRGLDPISNHPNAAEPRFAQDGVFTYFIGLDSTISEDRLPLRREDANDANLLNRVGRIEWHLAVAPDGRNLEVTRDLRSAGSFTPRHINTGGGMPGVPVAPEGSIMDPNNVNEECATPEALAEIFGGPRGTGLIRGVDRPGLYWCDRSDATVNTTGWTIFRLMFPTGGELGVNRWHIVDTIPGSQRHWIDPDLPPGFTAMYVVQAQIATGNVLTPEGIGPESNNIISGLRPTPEIRMNARGNQQTIDLTWEVRNYLGEITTPEAEGIFGFDIYRDGILIARVPASQNTLTDGPQAVVPSVNNNNATPSHISAANRFQSWANRPGARTGEFGFGFAFDYQIVPVNRWEQLAVNELSAREGNDGRADLGILATRQFRNRQNLNGGLTNSGILRHGLEVRNDRATANNGMGIVRRAEPNPGTTQAVAANGLVGAFTAPAAPVLSPVVSPAGAQGTSGAARTHTLTWTPATWLRADGTVTTRGPVAVVASGGQATSGVPVGGVQPAPVGHRDAGFQVLYSLSNRANFTQNFNTITATPAIPTPERSSFTDTTNHVNRTQIEWLNRTGIAAGWPDGTFRPDTNVSRQAAAAFLFRSFGNQNFVPPVESPFNDVPLTMTHYREAAWARSVNLTGLTGASFNPSAAVTGAEFAGWINQLSRPGIATPTAGNITRAQAAVMLHLAAQQPNVGHLSAMNTAIGQYTYTQQGAVPVAGNLTGNVITNANANLTIGGISNGTPATGTGTAANPSITFGPTLLTGREYFYSVFGVNTSGRGATSHNGDPTAPGSVPVASAWTRPANPQCIINDITTRSAVVTSFMGQTQDELYPDTTHFVRHATGETNITTRPWVPMTNGANENGFGVGGQVAGYGQRFNRLGHGASVQVGTQSTNHTFQAQTTGEGGFSDVVTCVQQGGTNTTITTDVLGIRTITHRTNTRTAEVDIEFQNGFAIGNLPGWSGTSWTHNLAHSALPDHSTLATHNPVMGTLATTARPQGTRTRNTWHGVTLRFDPLGRGNGDADTYSLNLTNTDGFNTVRADRSGITTVALTATASNVNGTTTLAITRANTVTANNVTSTPTLAHAAPLTPDQALSAAERQGRMMRWSRFELNSVSGLSGHITVTPDNNAESQVLTRSELAGSIQRPANQDVNHTRTWTIHLTDGHNTRVITSAVSLPAISGGSRSAWNTIVDGHAITRSGCVVAVPGQSHQWVDGVWFNGTAAGLRPSLSNAGITGVGGCSIDLANASSQATVIRFSDGINTREFGNSFGTAQFTGSARAWNPGTNHNGFHGTRSGCVEQNGTLLTHTWFVRAQVGGNGVSNGGCTDNLGHGNPNIGASVTVGDGRNEHSFHDSTSTGTVPAPGAPPAIPCTTPACVTANGTAAHHIPACTTYNPGTFNNDGLNTSAQGPGTPFTGTARNCPAVPWPAGSACTVSSETWWATYGVGRENPQASISFATIAQTNSQTINGSGSCCIVFSFTADLMGRHPTTGASIVVGTHRWQSSGCDGGAFLSPPGNWGGPGAGVAI